jgi:hypothetical protein
MPGGFWLKLFIVMAVIFFMGFFLDFIEIDVVVVPIVAPILLADPGANVTAVWLGVMIGLNIQTSFLTPPFGFALFYLRGVAPAAVKTIQMYKGVVPFIGLQLIALAIVANAPQLVNYLPNRVALLSDNSPPPRNPKLGYCVDQYISQEIALTGPAILASAQAANQMDFSVLPDEIANATQDGIDKVAKALEQLKLAKQAAVDVEAASAIYRPIHQNVRGLQRDAKTFTRAIEAIEDQLDDLPEDSSKIAGLKADIEELTGQKDALLAQIPSDWDDTHKAFQEVNKIEKKAFAIYRRLSSDAYTPAIETLDILNSGDAFRALEAAVMASKSIVTDNAPVDAIEPLKQLARKFSGVAGAGDIKSAISKARRAVKSKTPDKAKAQTQLDKAIELYKTQLQWRAKAEAEITPKLETYIENMKPTLGLREQKKFTREQALFVASCVSDHRDVSLNF